MTAWHLRQIGTTEYPPGSNNVRYNTEYYGREVSGSGYPWCMAYIWCGFHELGGTSLMPKTASCTALMNYAREIGAWVTDGYREGDIILYNFDRYPDADHVGYCLGFDGKRVECVEGNTSSTSADNGGAVMRVKRNASCVLGAYRPDYGQKEKDGGATLPSEREGIKLNLRELKKGDFGDDVTALQILLEGYGVSVGRCGADGDFGNDTDGAVRLLQTAVGLESDGIVGVKTWSKLLGVK